MCSHGMSWPLFCWGGHWFNTLPRGACVDDPKTKVSNSALETAVLAGQEASAVAQLYWHNSVGSGVPGNVKGFLPKSYLVSESKKDIM